MHYKVTAVIVLAALSAIAIQAIPVFPVGDPPAGGGKINFYGWPCVSFTTVANADRAGQILNEERDFSVKGVAVNTFVSVILTLCGVIGVTCFLLPKLPRLSVLDLLAFSAGTALVLAYFCLTPTLAAPIAVLQDSVSAHRLYSTDRPLIANILCSVMIFFSGYGLLSMVVSKRLRSKLSGG